MMTAKYILPKRTILGIVVVLFSSFFITVFGLFFQSAEFIKARLLPSSNILAAGDANSIPCDADVDMDADSIEEDLQPEHIAHEVEEVRKFASNLK